MFGELSEYLPDHVETLSAVVDVHRARLAEFVADTHFDLLPDDLADDLRGSFERAHSTDDAAVTRDLETIVRTRLRSVGVELVEGQLVGRVPGLTREQLQPVMLHIIATIDIGTLLDLHARPV